MAVQLAAIALLGTIAFSFTAQRLVSGPPNSDDGGFFVGAAARAITAADVAATVDCREIGGDETWECDVFRPNRASPAVSLRLSAEGIYFSRSTGAPSVAGCCAGGAEE